MPLFEFPELLFAQVSFWLLSLRWMLRRNDEIPLLINSFLFYVTGYRYLTISLGWNQWVNLSSFGFEPITENSALQALSAVVLGQLCLLFAYTFNQTKIVPILRPRDDPYLFRWLRPKAMILGLMCLPLVLVIRNQVADQMSMGSSLAFEVSGYLYLFPMVLIGVATLILCLGKFGGLHSGLHRIVALAILCGVVYLTYAPHSRFQFLAWIVAGSTIVSSSYRAKTRLIALAAFAIFGLSLFAVAGAMRNIQSPSGQLNQIAVERALGAEDGNMLDGFVLLQQVYPKHLEFSLGMQHLEIFMRPIPRSLWPEKPIGGYMKKFTLLTQGGKGTLGFSPTLFGIFYAEGGSIGIIVLSALYGYLLARIVRYSLQLHPFANILVRAVLCAALIPILRSGDMAGNYAWIGMAFWPCFLVLWYQRHYFKRSFPTPIDYQMRTLE